MMDNIREVTWQITSDMEILPDAPQFGGVQGEDNATLIRFDLADDCPIREGGYRLFIETVDATGAADWSEEVFVEDDAITHLVPLAWTQHGGHTSVRLIAKQDGQTAFTLRGVLRFDNRSDAVTGEKSVFRANLQEALEEMRGAREEFQEDAAAAAASAAAAQRSANRAQQEAEHHSQELEDLRKDYKGNVHDTAGNAVRVPMQEMAERVDDIAVAQEQDREVLDGALKNIQMAMTRANQAVSSANDANNSITQTNKRVENLEKSQISVDYALDPMSNMPLANAALCQVLADMQSVLTVTWSGEGYATHSFEQIYKHVKDGGTVVFVDHDGTVCNLLAWNRDSGYAIFGRAGINGVVKYIEVWDDSTAYVNLTAVECDGVTFIRPGCEDGVLLAFEEYVESPIPSQGATTVPRLHFYGTRGDEPALIGGVAPGVYPSDAATVGQLTDTVGSIDNALDAIIRMQAEMCGVTLITFYIDGYHNTGSYYAEEGMTWEEWCASVYNTAGYYIDEQEGHVCCQCGDAVVEIKEQGDFGEVYGNYRIYAGRSYRNDQ